LYDSDLGKFYAIDPAGQGWSPFVYAGNNPLIIVDKDGKLAWFVPILIGAAIGGTAGGIIAENNGKPWYQGALIGAAAGAFLGSGLAFGGAYGTAVGSAAFNTAQGYWEGGRGYDVLKYAGVGFATGYFGATGGFGLVGSKSTAKGWRIAGRLATQIISTGSRSIGNNWANPNISDADIFDNFVVGVGPVNLRFGNNQGWRNVLNLEDNVANAVFNGLGLLTTFTTWADKKSPNGSIGWDWNSLSLKYNNVLLRGLIGGFAEATGAYTLWNPTPSLLHAEGVHVWQSRIFGNSFLPVFFWNSLVALVEGNDSYFGNLFERQAHGYLGYPQW
jgi:hypothetical protein